MTLEELTKNHERAGKLYRSEVTKRTELEAEITKLQATIDAAINNADAGLVDWQLQKKRLQIQHNAQSRKVVESRLVERQALLDLTTLQNVGFEQTVKDAQATIDAAEQQMETILLNAPHSLATLRTEIHGLQRDALPRLASEMQALAKAL